MERAKKMVLISTENLEKMQHQQRPKISHVSSVGDAAKTELGQSTENEDNTVRTPGTILSRLDAEMYRILNSPILGYLYFFRQKENSRRRMRDDGDESSDVDDAGENTRPDDERTSNAEAANISTAATFAEDIPALDPHPPPPPPPPPPSPRRHHAKDTEGKELTPRRLPPRERGPLRRGIEQKSVREILKKVPKSYRDKANKLLTHLCTVAVPTRISWDKRGVTTIDGKFLRGTNIADLLNDAIRERKTVRAVGRLRFARLLREVATPPEFVGNPEIRSPSSSSSVVVEEENDEVSTSQFETPPRSASTPRAFVNRREPKRKFDESVRENDDKRAVFIATNENKNRTRVSGNVSKFSSKRRLINWNPLE